mmetsp:Transcript_1986/g.4772  ORF Transcript_1986/g.4772 Transcript_1986/m.4772 type:complete len:223 (-) Transcript_1986:313-981(-)
MTSHESSPRAALIKTLSWVAAITVGSHLDSLVSVRRKMASVSRINRSRVSTVSRSDSSFSEACPGIGMLSFTPSLITSAATSLRASAAACAFGLPRPWSYRQSSRLNKICRTVLEYETVPLSTKVKSRIPQPRSVRATEHPRVPAPSKRTRQLFCNMFTFRSGIILHFMSFRLRSAAWMARWFWSSSGLRLTHFGPGLCRALSSHPTTLYACLVLPLSVSVP